MVTVHPAGATASRTCFHDRIHRIGRLLGRQWSAARGRYSVRIACGRSMGFTTAPSSMRPRGTLQRAAPPQL